jgi:hypothetical protein
MTDPGAPKVIEEGFYLAGSDDGRKAKRVLIGEEPGLGWHIVSEGEFEAQADAVVAAAIRQVIAEHAERN